MMVLQVVSADAGHIGSMSGVIELTPGDEGM
jgi:deoxyxylulose-5-phosphate synthase